MIMMRHAGAHGTSYCTKYAHAVSISICVFVYRYTSTYTASLNLLVNDGLPFPFTVIHLLFGHCSRLYAISLVSVTLICFAITISGHLKWTLRQPKCAQSQFF
jgi:hypothetical protein